MVQAPPATYGDPTSSQAMATGWQGSTGRWSTGPTRFEPWVELMWAGVITGTVGYVFSIVAGIVEATQCCLNDPWPWFVPLAGPVFYPVVDHTVFASVLAAAIPASAAQLAGLVMLLVGGLARRPVYGSPAIEPGPGMAGISLRWDL